MKTSHITQRPLIESYIRNNNASVASYMRVMNENFVIPFNKTLTLLEAEMTAQQIQNAFGAAEKIATAGGDNRSLIGQGADAAGAAANAVGKGAQALGQGAAELAKKGAKGVKELADKLIAQHKAKFEKSLPPADAGEVPNFEQQAEQAAEQIQDPKAKQSIMDLIQQGLKNPVTQTLILTAVGSIATVVAGPAIAGLGLGAAATGALTGTVVGGLTGLVRGKLQGKDWKEAGKDALKGAGMGAAVGGIGGGIAQAGAAIADAHKAHQQAQAQPSEQPADGSKPMSDADYEREANKAVAQQNDMIRQGKMNQMGLVSDGHGGYRQPRPDEIYHGAGNGEMAVQGTEPQTPVAPEQQPVSDYPSAGKVRANLDQWRQDNAAQNAITPRIPPGASASDFSNTAPADTQQAEQPVSDYPSAGKVRANLDQWRKETGSPNAVKESITYVDKQLTARMWMLNESLGKPHGAVHLTNEGIADMFKKAGNWLKTKAGNLTNKVTADKLQQAWTKAGSPTDSGQVAAIMTQAGVPQETVDQVFTNLGLPQGSSTPAQAQVPQAAAPQGKGQGFLGKAAGAVGGAIGGVKGAIAGVKDAYAQGKEQGFDGSRANQAGDAVGASGEQNPYAKGTQAAQQPAAPAQQAPAQAQKAAAQPQPKTTQQPAAPAQASEEPGAVQKYGDAVGAQAKDAGNKVAGAAKSLAGAVQAGQGMGASGQSLMYPKASDDMQKIKDKTGKEHQYKKVGDKWVDMASNKEVDPATAAMLDRQQKQKAAGAAANAEMDKNAQSQKKVGQTQPAAQQSNPQAAPAAQPVDSKAETPAQQPADAQSNPQPAAAAQDEKPAVWKNNRNPQAPATSTPPAAKAQSNVGNDVMARMAKQLGSAPNGIPAKDGQQMPGYGKVTYNVPTGGIPQAPAIQPTTGAKAIPKQPAQQPAQQPAPAQGQAQAFGSRGIAGMDAAPTQPAQQQQEVPGFLQSKIKGRKAEPALAEMDFSAILAKRANIRL